MATSHDPNTQTIVALDVSLGFAQLGQRLWCVDIGTISGFAVDQPMQQVQHMRFGRHALIQRQFHSSDDNLFVVMEYQSEDPDHRPGGEASGLAVVERPTAIQRRVRHCAGHRACAE